MRKIIVFIVAFIAFQAMVRLIMIYTEVKSLKLDKQNLEKQITYLQCEIDRLSHLCSVRKSIDIPKGTIEAVRYAMIHNHPDNGGSAEKFILYKNCYDKLTGGR